MDTPRPCPASLSPSPDSRRGRPRTSLPSRAAQCRCAHSVVRRNRSVLAAPDATPAFRSINAPDAGPCERISAGPPRSCIIPTRAASTPRSPSVNAAVNGAWLRPSIQTFEGRPPIEAFEGRRWVRSGTATTTPWRRASSRRWRSELLARTRFQGLRPSTQGSSSSTSKDGITRTVATRGATSLRSTSRGDTRKLLETQAINRPLKRGKSTHFP